METCGIGMVKRGGIALCSRFIHLGVKEVANACHIPEANTFEMSVLSEGNAADLPSFIEVVEGAFFEAPVLAAPKQ